MPVEQALEGEPQVAVLRAKDGARLTHRLLSRLRVVVQSLD